MWKKWIIAFKVKVTAKGQNVDVYPHDIFLTAKHFVTKLGIVMHHNELECQSKKKSFAIFKVKVTARARMIKI